MTFDVWTHHSELALRHSCRFRKVSTRYPRRVAEAYDGDLDRAMADSDEQVVATVHEWERAQGLKPRDWPAIGTDERGDDELNAELGHGYRALIPDDEDAGAPAA